MGDLVLIRSHLLSNAEKQFTAKLAPRRDGPYQIKKIVSPTTCILCFPENPDKSVGKYHLSDLTLFTGHHRMTPDPEGESITADQLMGQLMFNFTDILV